MGMFHDRGNAVPFHGDHHPVSIYVEDQPIFEPIDQTQYGKTITFENTYNDVAEVTVFGESAQDGEPTPEAPVPIESIKSVELVSRNADGSKSATRSIDLQGHELRSLPDGTRDEVYIRPDGSVVLVERVGVCTVDDNTIFRDYIGSYDNVFSFNPGNGDFDCAPMSTHYARGKPGVSSASDLTINSSGGIRAYAFKDTRFTTKEEFKTWVAENPVTVVYKLATPTETILGTIDLPETFYDTTHIWEANGADISASVKVIP